MRGFLFCCTLICALFYNLIAQPSAQEIFRIGGMELPPYCSGCLLTQPHQQIDSTNINFENYYARMSLWMGGQTSGGDTLVTCADFISLSPAAGFNSRKAMPDSNNILQLPAFDHSYLSVYQDTAKGWQVKQYNLMVNNYAYGILLYEIEYNGKHGPLNQCYAGIKFDFDVPGTDNWPSGWNDVLTKTTDGFTIKDYYSGSGMEVQTLTANTLFNHWKKEQSPRNLKQVYQALKTENIAVSSDTADYHFSLSRGPYAFSGNEVIVLAFLIEPHYAGMAKASVNQSELLAGVNKYKLDKNLAKPDLSENLNQSTLPDNFFLADNYPNPFNPATRIDFRLPNDVEVEMTIYNNLGQQVKKLVAAKAFKAGSHSVHWDGSNDAFQPVASGIYYYQLKAADFLQVKQMLLIR